MHNYANEVLFVEDPNGNECVFITARFDYRSDKELTNEVNKNCYFGGPGYKYLRKVVVLDGLTKEQADSGIATLLTYYESMGYSILNKKVKPLSLAA